MTGRSSQRFSLQGHQGSSGTGIPAAGEPNALKSLLDEGNLGINRRYRDFTAFFDLRKNFHNEFLGRVWGHVDDRGYLWKDLLDRESERKSCAASFLRQYGKEYWGSEANRQKYLMADSLADPESLSAYPERKEELTRALMNLLEKKAKGNIKAAAKSGDLPTNPPQSSPNSTSGLVSSQASNYSSEFHTPSGKQGNDGRRGKKRQASIDLTDSYAEFKLENADSSLGARQTRGKSLGGDIRPFNCIITADNPDKRRKSVPAARTALKKQDQIFDDVIIVDNPDDSKLIHAQADSSTDSTLDHQPTTDKLDHKLDHKLAARYSHGTKFLVSASTQSDMAPVWVSFQHFDSSPAFIDCMVEESGLREWNPSAQLMGGVSLPVIAASVKLEWSGAFIRVRPSHDGDWQFVLQELEKAWRARDQNPKGGDCVLEGGFRIRVTLHVAG